MSKYLKILTKILLLITFISILIIIFIIIHLKSNLPSVEVLKDVKLQVPLRIYSADDKLIAEYGEKRRIPVTLDQIPKDLIYAILATEDRRFFQHPGVDIRGLARAMMSFFTKSAKGQGGSTITMQVARNFFLTREKTYIRKFNEILLAIKIEQKLTKKEILELYLNKIYLGKRAYGIAAAAKVYYGTTIDNLTLAQMAMIAGLPQAPSAINPINSPAAALKRRAHVLNRMQIYQFITTEQYSKSIKEPITAFYHAQPIELKAPYVSEMVRQEMIKRFGEDAYYRGYKVVTTINSGYQIAANQAQERALLEYDERHGFRKPTKTLYLNKENSVKENLKIWQSQLHKIPCINTLIPGVVTTLETNKIFILLKDNRSIEIPFYNMKWAKPQLTNYRLGPIPKTPKDIVALGNIVYVQKKGNIWYLSQIPEVEGAIVALNPDNGAILALVGGFDYEHSSFNRATQAERQPGSIFKPFIYGAALEKGFTTASIINDAPIVQEDCTSEYDWRPQNHTKKFYGPTRFRVGITHSRNLISIRLLKAMGIENTIDILEKIGFTRDLLPKGLSLALGTTHATPLGLTAAYCTFPNGGYKIQPHFIKKIIDHQNTVIYKATHPNAYDGCKKLDIPLAVQTMKPQTAYLVTSLLQDTIQASTIRRTLQLDRLDLAGKTGTTNGQCDAWFAGYNRDIVATAWVGFDEPRSLNEYAIRATLPMWGYFMKKVLKGQPEHSPEQPSGLVTVRIDPQTGLLARTGQPDAIYEIFTQESVPAQIAPPCNSESNADDSIIELESIF